MGSHPRPTTSSEPSVSRIAPVWQLLGTVVTALATVLVAYFGAIKPATKDTVTEQLDQSDAAREEQLGQGIAVVTNARPAANTSGYRLILIGFCNATPQPKEIEMKIGPSLDRLSVVASASGTDRSTVTCIVPKGWFYQITYTQVPNGSCDVTAWKL